MGRRRGAECWRARLATSDREERLLFLNSLLPLLAGCSLSAGALSTPRLPSIPGLFLCERQHPASACLTAPEHNVTTGRRFRAKTHFTSFWQSRAVTIPASLIVGRPTAIQTLVRRRGGPRSARISARLAHWMRRQKV